MSRDIFPFLLGFLSISTQIFLLREFQVHFYGNEMVYGFVLGFWLLWGSLGSLFASKLPFQKKQLALLFEITLIFIALTFISLRLIRFIWGKPFGESLGLTASFFSALICCFFLSFPFGLLFFLNVLFLDGQIARVYLLEALGACLAGLAVDFGLIPHVSCWPSLTIIGLFSLLLILIFSPTKKNWFLIASTSLILISLSIFDWTIQKIAAKPFPLIESRDSRFGRWQVIKIDDQMTLYQNGMVAASIPDPAEAEEIIHFALLQRPEAKRILLIGGGFGGAIEEALKYPLAKIDYVEIDPSVIYLLKDLLSPEKRAFFESPRLNLHYLDGRTFLQKSTDLFDIIILAGPEPSTAQLNRFYTREFFSLVKQHLAPGGVVSLRLSSAENYQNPSLVRYLRSNYSTLASVFSYVEIIPGDTNIFLASDDWLSIDFNYLVKNLENYQIDTKFIRPETLLARLNPLRLNSLKSKITPPFLETNSDLKPRGYLYYLVYWATQFGLTEAKVMEFWLKIPALFLILLPLFLIIALFCPLLISKGKAAFPALPLLVLGFTSLMAEVLILLWFQLQFGYIYEKIALLITWFMLGLLAGSFLSLRLGSLKALNRWLIVDQALILLILSWLFLLLPVKIPNLIPYLFLFLLGGVGGHLFILSNQPLIRESQSYGFGYSLDLAGSFLGAILGPPLFFPILGLPLSIFSLLILNFFCLIILLIFSYIQKR
ncbi:MAG: hypothetical protein N3B16_03515 [Candidatus Aminicenantes bacterium]|nr:hypothetical protein [Candidatus Aminicenantes bacterium]